MLDASLRPIKDRTLGPLASVLAPRAKPVVLSGISLGAGLGAAVAAATGAVVWSLLLWWASRLADGLDGPVARARATASDLGGFVDLVGDAVVYVAVPVGVAAGRGDRATWIAAAVLIATFYVNAVAWLYVSAALAKRGQTMGTPPSATSIVMPPGLVEGTETIVLYSAFLAFPDQARWWFWAMAGLVAVTVLLRVDWARHVLGDAGDRSTPSSERERRRPVPTGRGW